MAEQATRDLSPEQQAMLDLWQQHVMAEFVTKRVEDALETMTEDAYVLNVPVATGGFGKDGVRAFYANVFIPQIPPDLQATPVTQTIGQDRLVEEAVYTFTHSIQMDWMLPGVAPTGQRVEVAVVGVIAFRDGKMASEHLYWDHASVLAQLGVLKADTPGVAGAGSARALLNPKLLSSRASTGYAEIRRKIGNRGTATT